VLSQGLGDETRERIGMKKAIARKIAVIILHGIGATVLPLNGDRPASIGPDSRSQ
jgi:hypothetical protein